MGNAPGGWPEAHQRYSVAVSDRMSIRQPVSLSGFRHGVPSTWVKLTGDIAFPLEVQDEMAARAGCREVVEIDCGHMAMITRPDDLAGILNRIHTEADGDRAM